MIANGSIEKDVPSRSAPRAGGDRVILPFEVEDKRGAGIVEQVRDHRTNALAGAGRGAGQDMPVVIKPAAAVRCVRQIAEGKGIGRGGGLRMPGSAGVRRPTKTGRAMGGRRGRSEQDSPDPT